MTQYLRAISKITLLLLIRLSVGVYYINRSNLFHLIHKQISIPLINVVFILIYVLQFVIFDDLAPNKDKQITYKELIYFNANILIHHRKTKQNKKFSRAGFWYKMAWKGKLNQII